MANINLGGIYSQMILDMSSFLQSAKQAESIIQTLQSQLDGLSGHAKTAAKSFDTLAQSMGKAFRQAQAPAPSAIPKAPPAPATPLAPKPPTPDTSFFGVIGKDAAKLAASYLTFQAALSGVSAIVSTTVHMESLSAALNAVAGSTTGGTEAMEFLRETAKRLGIDFMPLAESYKSITAASRGTVLEGQKARDIFLAVAEAGRVFQLDGTKVKLSLEAISQMISKGKVTAEEFRQQLGDHLPGAANVGARALGVTTAELYKMMEAGQLGMDFLVKFGTQLRKEVAGGLEEASQTSAAAFARFNNSMLFLADSIGKSGLVSGLASVAEWLATIIDKLTKASPAMLEFAKQQAATKALMQGTPIAPETKSRVLDLQEQIAKGKDAIADVEGRSGVYGSVSRFALGWSVDMLKKEVAEKEKALQVELRNISAIKARLSLEKDSAEAANDRLAAMAAAPYKGLGAVPEQYKEIVRRASEQYGLNQSVFAALIEQESGFKPRAISKKGAMGLTQLMPGTAKDLGVADGFDPWQNIYGGAKYLREQLNTFEQDYTKALMAYNAGAGNVISGKAYKFPETVDYVRKIQALTTRNLGDTGGGPLAGVTLQDAADVRAAEEEAKRAASERVQTAIETMKTFQQQQQLANQATVESISLEARQAATGYDMVKAVELEGKARLTAIDLERDMNTQIAARLALILQSQDLIDESQRAKLEGDLKELANKDALLARQRQSIAIDTEQNNKQIQYQKTIAALERERAASQEFGSHATSMAQMEQEKHLDTMTAGGATSLQTQKQQLKNSIANAQASAAYLIPDRERSYEALSAAQQRGDPGEIAQAQANYDATLNKLAEANKNIEVQENKLALLPTDLSAAAATAVTDILQAFLSGSMDIGQMLGKMGQTFMAPLMGQLTSGIQGFAKDLGISEGTGNLIMAGIGIAATAASALLNKQKAEVKSMGDEVKDTIEQTEQQRGLIAGEQQIAIARLSDQLGYALQPTNQILIRIETAIRALLPGGGTGTAQTTMDYQTYGQSVIGSVRLA